MVMLMTLLSGDAAMIIIVESCNNPTVLSRCEANSSEIPILDGDACCEEAFPRLDS